MTDERPDIIRSALEWRAEEHRRTRQMNGGPDNEDDLPLPMEPLSVKAGRPVPERRFIDRANIFPHRNVVLLQGDGGTGKSLLALQLALACTTGSPWLGIEVDPGPVIYLSAEEDEDEIHARAAEICAAEHIDMAEAHTLNPIYMAGKDCVLAYEKQGKLVTTPLFRRLDYSMAAIAPEMLILDNQADVFGGNENARALAKQFIGMLRGLAIKHDCTVLLLGHPSLTGLASGSGMSGSTAWSNSVRSRLYLHRPDSASLEAEDENARILEVKKANYAAIGTRYNLKWVAGRFVRKEARNPWDRVSTADLDRVRDVMRSGRFRVNEQAVDWGGYAVADLLGLDIGRGIPPKQRSAEQDRLRHDVRTYLGQWVRNKALFVVYGLDAYRRPTQFFSPNPPEEKPE
ncbi:AAA family ATPase [Mesorhizobium sp.]|uniref:AAA family ATPase n=1 Tax=Mesorhizobium sp. TaxID=1871066 RepID=UPI00257F7192|nr:AAA family ATPase [Mesorhizobium sp.]